MRNLVVAALVCLLGANTGFAGFINGSFEEGLNGWLPSGVSSLRGPVFGPGPTDGLSHVLLESTDGGAATTGVELERFLEIAPGTLSGLSSGTLAAGSALKQVIAAASGDLLSFDWNFLTDESTELTPPPNPDFNDIAFVVIGDSTFRLADTNSSFVVSSTTFGAETGYRRFSFQVPTTGTYFVGFGVANVGDSFINSGLLIDNVRLTPAGPIPPTPVPAPSTLVLLLLGVSCLTLLSRSRRRRLPAPRGGEANRRPAPTVAR